MIRRGLPARPWTALGLLGAAALALALVAPPAGAEGRIQKLRGHVGLGYGKLIDDPAPGGSFSMGVGVDYPVSGSVRAGLAFGYDLLGGRVVERGSITAGVDYSMLELLALVHWEPDMLGPLGRISLGTGIFSARAELATSGGGAGFSDLAVEEVVPGLALDFTVIQRRPSPVRIGIETGLRLAFVEAETWRMVLARLAFHY